MGPRLGRPSAYLDSYPCGNPNSSANTQTHANTGSYSDANTNAATRASDN
jgi:hypothetical protein